MRERINIDRDWRFCQEDDSDAMHPGHDDSQWHVLDVPHDWSIEATPHPDNPARAGGGFFPGGTGWYRKELPIPTDLGGRRVLIEFDGVYMNSDVWCNGNHCGSRPYGYSSFHYDLTSHVVAGETAVIAVRVDNSQQRNSRWYSGSGIYRHVWLTVASPIRVGHWGTYVTTPTVVPDEALVECAATIVNEGPTDTDVQVCSTLIDRDGQDLVSAASKEHVKSGDSVVVESVLSVTAPRLWSPDRPELYTLRTTIYSGDDVLDVYDTPCGIRSLKFDANEGFFLNGESMKLKGVNEHHDAGCLGAAVPDDVIRRRFRILKEMGCNAIRVAHNPASPTSVRQDGVYGRRGRIRRMARRENAVWISPILG
jgi:beta-galactosidase